MSLCGRTVFEHRKFRTPVSVSRIKEELLNLHIIRMNYVPKHSRQHADSQYLHCALSWAVYFNRPCLFMCLVCGSALLQPVRSVCVATAFFIYFMGVHYKGTEFISNKQTYIHIFYNHLTLCTCIYFILNVWWQSVCIIVCYLKCLISSDFCFWSMHVYYDQSFNVVCVSCSLTWRSYCNWCLEVSLMNLCGSM